MNTIGTGFRKSSSRLAIALGVLWLGWLPERILAQGNLSTVISNGPAARRINVVVLSEGYTTNQLATFLSDATNAVNNLLAQAPYQEYKSYFNAFAISVASAQSGSDHPNWPLWVDTYFNSTFFSYYPAPASQYLLTIPPNYFDTNYSHGQGKVDALLTNLMPDYDMVVMVVNDFDPGGSGNPDGSASQPLITSLNYYGQEIVAHESGHAFGKLTDEYDTAWPGYVPSERPNATAQTNRALIRWTSWISTNTPLPTPPVASNATVAGLFQGAQYQTTGWYRPKLDCKMRTLGAPFCEICSEQLVKSIYGLIRPIDAFSPTSTNLSLYSTQAVAFGLTLLQPLTHNLAVQWFTNNTAISGATNPTFSLAPNSLGSGTHKLRAVVSDPTTLVRNDPSGLLRQTNTWTLNLSLNNLSLISAQYLASNRFRLTVTGAAPQGFVIQASTNLTSWSPLTTNSLLNGKFDFTNFNLTNLIRRYYRTISPP